MAIVLALLLTLGLAVGVMAQTSSPTSEQPAGASTPGGQPATGGSGSAPSPGGSAPSPGGSSVAPGAGSDSSGTQATTPRAPYGRSGDVDVKGERSDDSPAASPRMSGSETRVFGVSPLVAVLIAAALLVVVILAIVSMSRAPSTHSERIDVDRRF